MNRFLMGKLGITDGANTELLPQYMKEVVELFRRHSMGDWGEVDAEDRAANERSVENGTRILSAYTLKCGVRVWIITEADRSRTTLLLPNEY